MNSYFLFAMPLGSGRQKCSEWNEVNKVVNDKSKVSCKYCNVLISSKIERVRLHLQKCKKKTNSDDDFEISNINQRDEHYLETQDVAGCSRNFPSATLLLDSTSSNEIVRTSSVLSMCSTSSVSETSVQLQPRSSTPNPIAEKVRKQKLMDSFAISISTEQKDMLDLQVARFFFSANIPFRSVENDQFIQLNKMLRPGYLPPNRKKLAGALLEKVNEEVAASMKSEIEKDNITITIMQDGWSSTRNDPIIAHSIHTGSEPYLISITDPGSNRKTAEYCAALATEAITHVKETFNKDVSNNLNI